MDCEKKGQFSKIKSHFDSHGDHEDIPTGPSHLKKGILKVDLSNHYFEDWKKTLKIGPVNLQVDCRDCLFLIYRDDLAKLWHFYVCFIGSKANAANFRFIICITAANGVSF